MRCLILFLLLITLPAVLGHVGYVLDDESFAENAGPDTSYLLSPLLDPFNIILILATLIIVVVLYRFLPKLNIMRKEFLQIDVEAYSYYEFIPWIARLGLGLALIGAGSQSVLISPVLPIESGIGTLQILFGFLLLAGLLTGPITVGVVVLYFIGLFQDFYLIGNLDFLGLALALLLLGNTKPGLDDLAGIPFITHFQKYTQYLPYVLTGSVGFAMAWLALYEKLLNPHVSALVVQSYELTSVIPVSVAMWVLAAGLIELVVGLALLFRWRVRLMSAVAFLVLSLSFFYFNEDVYSHVTLFAILSTTFILGNDK